MGIARSIKLTMNGQHQAQISGSDAAAVTWIANNQTALTNGFNKVKNDFFAVHTAADHPRQRQKLRTWVLAALASRFPDQDFTISLVDGVVTASVKAT
jgi:hypothetical protein